MSLNLIHANYEPSEQQFTHTRAWGPHYRNMSPLRTLSSVTLRSFTHVDRTRQADKSMLSPHAVEVGGPRDCCTVPACTAIHPDCRSAAMAIGAPDCRRSQRAICEREAPPQLCLGRPATATWDGDRGKDLECAQRGAGFGWDMDPNIVDFSERAYSPFRD